MIEELQPMAYASTSLPRCGRLVFVSGPIAAGKYPVLNYVKQQFSGRSKVFFAHRYVTGVPASRVSHDLLISPEEFRQRLEANVFVASWERDGASYAIGCEINHWLAKSAHVVVHGSVRCWNALQVLYPDMLTVWITASAECLRTRLYARGVHDLGEIRRILAQEDNLKPPSGDNVVCIKHQHAVEEAGKQLIRVLDTDLHTGRYG